MKKLLVLSILALCLTACGDIFGDEQTDVEMIYTIRVSNDYSLASNSDKLTSTDSDCRRFLEKSDMLDENSSTKMYYQHSDSRYTFKYTTPGYNSHTVTIQAAFLYGKPSDISNYELDKAVIDALAKWVKGERRYNIFWESQTATETLSIRHW